MPTLPFGIGKHSNRSQHGLDEAALLRERASASQSNLSSVVPDDTIYESRANQQPQYSALRNETQGVQQYPNNIQNIDPRFHDQIDTPSRSQSQRYSTGYPQPPSTHDIRPLPVDDGNDNLANVHKSYSTSGPNPRLAQQPPPDKEKKSRTKGFFGGFSSKSKDKPEQAPAPSTDYNNTSGLGRKASKSSKTLPSGLQQRTQQAQPTYPQFSTQGSETHLPSPQEGDEDDRDHRYQQNPESFQEITTQQQNYDPRSHPSIRIGRVDDDPSIRQVGESPTSHQQYVQQQQQQQQFHQQQRLTQQLHNPISAEESLEGDYPPALHAAPSQAQQQFTNQLYTNLPYRSVQNPEVVSQLSRESPTEAQGDPRPPVSATQSAGYPSSPTDYPSRPTSFQERRPESQQPVDMVPPSGNSQNRRSTDAKAQLGTGEPRGPPPGYGQQFAGQGGSGTAPLPPTPSSRPSGLRGEYIQGNIEQGRSTPPLPSEKSGDAAELDKLVIKYKKVKGLYFEKNAQVEQLQNTLANQRLSQSRTSLDDNEYATRFNRLDGAIKEIAFAIRKDWKIIPQWLQPYVNADAQKVGTKEMTAVGRASISRWIYEEIFCKCFVPGLDLGLSADLKRMEQNIRIFASPPTNLEEENALTAKVIQWKLTTIDSLADRLTGADALETKASYTRMAVSNLTAHLMNHLAEPTPQGIEGNATSIIELAISICMHLPKESREIVITYPLPGDMVQATGMKVETGLPLLESPMSEIDGEAQSISSGDRDDEEKGGKLRMKKDEAKMASAKKPIERDGKNDNKIRFAAFMGVEVKGRQWLVNAPVWTLG